MAALFVATTAGAQHTGHEGHNHEMHAAHEGAELNPHNPNSGMKHCAEGCKCAKCECAMCGKHAGHNVEIRGMRYVDRQGGYWRDMNRDYLNVGYVFQTSFDKFYNDGPPLTANTKKGWGMSVVYGTSYILHREPVWNRVHFGLDATWVDANYVEGKLIRGTARTHQMDLGMGIGPAMHIDAGGDWMVEIHFRYNPTFSTFYNEARTWEEARIGYASMWTSGASASWRRLALGAEVRFGGGNYHMLDYSARDQTPWTGASMPPDPQGPGGPIEGSLHDRVMRMRTIGARVFVGMRF